MKTKFNRVLSIICILSMLLSCVPFVGVQAADELSIITAQFVPYDQEIRVLADIPDDFTAKVYVAGTPINCEKTVTSDGTLLTSSNFVPSVYGIVPVKLEATNGTETLSDTQNVKIVKAFSKAESLSEDFNDLEAMTMSDATDATVVNAIKANNSMLSISGVINTTNIRKYVDITKDYTQDGSSALTMRFESTVASGLPSLRLNPSTDGTNGIIEISYDFMTSNTEIRQTIYPISRAYTSKYTFTTNDGTSFASSFQAVHYSTHCFGSTDKKIEVNKWYNIRFLMNLNDLTFEYYVNNELINYGTFIYQDSSYTEDYIYGINYFDLSAGTQGTAGASHEEPASVTFDNMKIAHINTGASPASLLYSLSGEETDVKNLNAEIPFNAESIKLGLDNAITYTEGDITLKKIDGTTVDASVTYCEGMPYASGKNRSGFIITPDNTLELGEEYKIFISPNAKFGSNTYEAPTEIYFKSIGMLTVISPKDNISVNAGEKVELKACTPNAVAVDLYVNDVLVSTLTPDNNACVSYLYDTANSSLGTKNVRFVILKADDTIEELNTSFDIVKVSNFDIIPLNTFENGYSDEFTTAKQSQSGSANSSSAETRSATLDNRNAAGVYYVPAKSSKVKMVAITESLGSSYSGRIVLEHDLYLEDANAEIQYGFKDSDANVTYYPYDVQLVRKQIDNGLIGGIDLGSYKGWHKIKLVLDTVSKNSEMYFDNNLVGISDSWAYNYPDNDCPPEAVDTITITYFAGYSPTVGTEALAMGLDNWHIYKEMPLPAVSTATAFDNLANSAALEQGGLVSNNANKFEIDVPNAIYANKESLLDNFKVTADGENVNIENTVLSDGTLTFDVAALPENADLEFVFGKDTLLYDGVTTIGSDVVFNLKVADDTGLYAKRYISLTADKAKAVFKTDSFSDKSVVLIIATYADDVLTGITTQPVNAAEADITTLALPTSGSTHAKAFIWGSLDTAYPVSAGEIKVSVK